MNTLKQSSYANPYPNLNAHELGAALLPVLERRFPKLASEFRGLFSPPYRRHENVNDRHRE